MVCLRDLLVARVCRKDTIVQISGRALLKMSHLLLITVAMSFLRNVRYL